MEKRHGTSDFPAIAWAAFCILSVAAEAWTSTRSADIQALSLAAPVVMTVSVMARWSLEEVIPAWQSRVACLSVAACWALFLLS